jgi:hypothetical protein
VKSLTLGSSSGSTNQQLDLAASPGHKSTLSFAAASSVQATGEIVLDSQSSGGYAALEGGPAVTLSNSGSIVSQVEGANLDYLETNLTNAAGGTVEVKSGELRQDENTTTTNDGYVVLDTPGQFNMAFEIATAPPPRSRPRSIRRPTANRSRLRRP